MLSLILGALALAIWGILVVTPSATITIQPAREKISIQRQITAELNPSAENGSVGARSVSIVSRWESGMVPSGQAELAANPARGQIVFANLTSDPQTIPAGTTVFAIDGSGNQISFRTNGVAELPAANGATAEVDIVAIEVGPEGNLAAGSISAAEGDWGSIVEVSQPLATFGGNIQPVPVVTEADRQALSDF